MSTRVLICDDSKIARKQLARILPTDWDVDVEFAEDGQEALDILSSSVFDLLFLDLNMPIKDGYETLEALQSFEQAPAVIVVSGDVQPKAIQRVKDMGAIAFHKKPATAEDLRSLLISLGLFTVVAKANVVVAEQSTAAEQFTLNECLQEVSNIAMGRAASVLAEMLNVFIKLPVPTVNILEVGELQMALDYSVKGDSCSAVSQGFVGSGIAFETLLIFSDSSFPDMAKLLNVREDIDSVVEVELLMDVSSVLVGPFIDALGKQLNIDFSQSHPVLLAQHARVSDLVNAKKAKWKRTLAVEIVYEVENYQISCDLMLLFTEDSVSVLENLLSYLVEED
ncbi:MAG: chemotaxis protein CheY-P-specific phosphatase CheC/AmiR [Candidatus Azotimanducaceae bacterium]|jgi:chemotaxis protein CheY-P-specific phosphatase CheC/AmiR/NasT family two-component response regulator|uniref:response regulator n=1 Tax=Marinomonas primoryensis TaxID=178399 RepID=UPI0037044465